MTIPKKPELDRAVILVTPYGNRFTNCLRTVDTDGRGGLMSEPGLLYKDEDEALEAAERWANGVHERLKVPVEVRVTEVVIRLPDWGEQE